MNNRAIVYYKTGRLDLATRTLEQLLQSNPEHADAVNNVAAIAIEQGDCEKAKAYAARSIEISNSAEAWLNQAIALDQLDQDPELAERSVREALSLAPDYWQASYSLSIILRKQGRFAEAESALLGVLMKIPSNAVVHRSLAELYAGELAQPAKARKHYNALIRVSRNPQEQALARKRLEELAPEPM